MKIERRRVELLSAGKSIINRSINSIQGIEREGLARPGRYVNPTWQPRTICDLVCGVAGIQILLNCIYIGAQQSNN